VIGKEGKRQEAKGKRQEKEELKNKEVIFLPLPSLLPAPCLLFPSASFDR
jgi:hypothetical protein